MMPAGKYYVGDLCYVMQPQWDEFCAITCRGHDVLDGEFTLKNGVRFATIGTSEGDGVFEDQHGACYPVDAGLIGCICVDDINDPKADLESGQIVEFDEDFECSYDNGVIWIGDIRIDTNSHDNDEYEEKEDEDN